MPKKDQQGYYGFDPSGLERAATVNCFDFSPSLGCQILGRKLKRKRSFFPRSEKRRDQADGNTGEYQEAWNKQGADRERRKKKDCSVRAGNVPKESRVLGAIGATEGPGEAKAKGGYAWAAQTAWRRKHSEIGAAQATDHRVRKPVPDAANAVRVLSQGPAQAAATPRTDESSKGAGWAELGLPLRSI